MRLNITSDAVKMRSFKRATKQSHEKNRERLVAAKRRAPNEATRVFKNSLREDILGAEWFRAGIRESHEGLEHHLDRIESWLDDCYLETWGEIQVVRNVSARIGPMCVEAISMFPVSLASHEKTLRNARNFKFRALAANQVTTRQCQVHIHVLLSVRCMAPQFQFSHPVDRLLG